VKALLSTPSHFGEVGTGSATVVTGIVRRKTNRSVAPELVSAGIPVLVTRGDGPRIRRRTVARGSGGQTDMSPLSPVDLD
jgi:hypothetical protein